MTSAANHAIEHATAETDPVSTTQQLADIRQRMRERRATAQDHVLYNVLRGKPALRGFRPLTNPRRFENGQSPAQRFMHAVFEQFRPLRLRPEVACALNPRQQSALRQLGVQLLCEDFERAVTNGTSLGRRRNMLIRLMSAVPQGSTTVWGHCRQTALCATKLCRALDFPHHADACRLPSWLPSWFLGNAQALRLSPYHAQLLKTYLAWHDCGKPFVYKEGERAQVHYPEHARTSACIWAKVQGSPQEQYLMLHDMDLHLMGASEVAGLAAHPLAKVQLVAALASLWANCADFGGPDSASFKAKLKHIDRRGRALCKLFEAQSHA